MNEMVWRRVNLACSDSKIHLRVKGHRLDVTFGASNIHGNILIAKQIDFESAIR